MSQEFGHVAGQVRFAGKQPHIDVQLRGARGALLGAMSLPEKHRVLSAVVEKLSEVLAQMAQAAEETRKDATHEEAKPENDKDTRALEQSYLARGQAMRAEQLAEQKEVLRFMPLPTLSADSVIWRAKARAARSGSPRPERSPALRASIAASATPARRRSASA